MKFTIKPIKQSHLILGSVGVLILACVLVFFMSSNVNKPNLQNTITDFEEDLEQIESIEETQVKEMEDISNNIIKTSQETMDKVFMDINIQAENNGSDHPVITSAFGFKIGEKFDENRAIAKLELSSGDTIYEVEPENPYMGIGKYYITTKENTNTINSVRGKGLFDSLKEAESELDKLELIIEKIYNEVYLQNEFRYYKDEQGNILLLFLKPREDGKYTLHLHCLDIK